MGFKKKGAIYSVIALMLCVAVYLNWSYSKTESDTAAVAAGVETPVDSKLIGQSVLVDSTSPEGAIGVLEAQDSAASAAVAEDYFAEARLSRQRARDEAVSILNTTLESDSAEDEARAAAGMGIELLAANAQMESSIESLVKAKGYQDCVVFIGGDSIHVIVSKTEAGLAATDVAKIRDIVLGEATVSAEQIKIIETA